MATPPDIDESGDLDALARALDAPRGAARTAAASGVTEADAGAEVPPRLDAWLRSVAQRGASDLLLLSGEPPALRIEGRVMRLDGAPLDGDEIQSTVIQALPAHARQAYREQGIADAACRLAGVGRFRINLHRERGRAAAAIRMLPARTPVLASLELPPGTELLARLPRGLVLVGGTTGSGKTTTIAALVDDINRREAKHIITIEDPIEYEHVNHRSVVQQVEIGIDAPDFPTALRSALRQAPDVIVVGEMRDPETMRIALAAGETGHLVFSTLHTADVPATIARLTDSFPDERQPTIRQEVASALTAVFVQTLLPRVGGGRVAAAELLVMSYGARQHIRRNALHHLHQEIAITRKQGSFSIEECLARMTKAGIVEQSEAEMRVSHPDDYRSALLQ